jgi:DNA mismatch endonuclease (patch repair protein)
MRLANRGRDTKPELLLRRALQKSGIFGFKVNYRIGTTHVDVAFPSKWVAVEVHGCLWHRCPICKLELPKTRTGFWERKFALNVERDARVRESLRRDGWTLLEFWEHELYETMPRCVENVRRALFP